jgi:nitrite reductase/ring-hydroxylating ferredoxin subunit
VDWIKIFSSQAEMERALNSGQPRLLVVQGKRICIVRREQDLYAVEDKCPHNGESLSKGTVNYLGEIICPWHGQRFNLKTGREGEERSRDLITYPVKQEQGVVYIGL